jgi:hypothetical protein
MTVSSRRLGAAAALLAAAAGISVGLADAGPAANPQLRVTSLAPFTVMGSGFHDGETVRVFVRTEGDFASTRDRASASGRIGAVRFRGLHVGKCPVYVVGARGNEGSRAGLRSPPRPCGPVP